MGQPQYPYPPQPAQQYPPMAFPNGQPSYSYGPQYGAPAAPVPPPAPQAQPAQPTFVSPGAPGSGGDGNPKIYELDGCLVAFSPTQFTAAGTGDNLTGFGKDAPRDRITTGIIVLETPGNAPITIGRSEPNGTPTHVMTAPARFSGVWMSSQNIVKALAPGGQPLIGAMVLGRIQRSEVGQRPWNLVAVDGTPDMDRAIQLWSALSMGAMQYNDPQPLAPPAPPNSAQYGPPAMPPQGYAPSPVPPQPTAWMGQHPPQMPTSGQVYPPGQYPGLQPIASPQPPPPARPAPTLPQHLIAAGWTDATWAQLTSEQQSQVLASTPMR